MQKDTMGKGNMTYKRMSELPDEVREKIYSLRLYDEFTTPIDEYIERFCIILVDDCLYYADDDVSKMIVNDFKKSDENGLRFKRLTLSSAVVKDGYVIKNRFGQTETIEEPKMTQDEVYKNIAAFEAINKRVSEVLETLKIIPEFEYIDHIEFEDGKAIAFCENRLDNDSSAYSVPIEYLWMKDTELKETHQAKLEEERKKREADLAEQQRKKEEAKKKRQRTIYEKLKKKFEGE